MRKSIIVWLLCSAVLLAAYVGGIVTTIQETIMYIAGTATDFMSFSVLGISPCGGGDEGGGGRPGFETGGG